MVSQHFKEAIPKCDRYLESVYFSTKNRCLLSMDLCMRCHPSAESPAFSDVFRKRSFHMRCGRLRTQDPLGSKIRWRPNFEVFPIYCRLFFESLSFLATLDLVQVHLQFSLNLNLTASPLHLESARQMHKLWATQKIRCLSDRTSTDCNRLS